jgi:hypothetical protein
MYINLFAEKLNLKENKRINENQRKIIGKLTSPISNNITLKIITLLLITILLQPLFCGKLFVAFADEASLQEDNNQSFDTVIEKLLSLEEYSEEYILENDTDFTATELCCMFVRSEHYNSATWRLMAGVLPEGFEDYINEKDSTLFELRNAYAIQTPSGDTVDFIHLMASINMALEKHGDLGSWVGDICELTSEAKLKIDSEEDYYQLAQNLFNVSNGGSFGHADLIADMDAINIYNLYKENSLKLGDLIKDYYGELSEAYRLQDFCYVSFSIKPDEDLDFEAFYKKIESKFNDTSFTKLLLTSLDVDKELDKEAIEASLRVFSEYLYENYPKEDYLNLDKADNAPTSENEALNPSDSQNSPKLFIYVSNVVNKILNRVKGLFV